MHLLNVSGILVENAQIDSEFLQRTVKVDFYLPKNVEDPPGMSLLLINDGQNMDEMNLGPLLEKLYANNEIEPLICVAIHAGTDRRMEYGTAQRPDYCGHGAKAGLYSSFIFEELLPFIQASYFVPSYKEKAFAGFSLGGLTALDLVWNYPGEFKKAGVFSGSLWWRSIDQDDPEYDDQKDRIMHQQIRKGDYHPGQQFFFQCGNMDEKKDRNNNGIIDSIDDTLDLIEELVAKGYDPEKDICYLEMKDGRHDLSTWARALPVFLKWGWGVGREKELGIGD